MSNSLDFYFQIADKITNLAGTYLTKHFGSTKKMFHKYGNQYGVKDDLVCNKIYEDYLEKFTPEVSIYSEEGKQNISGEFTWTIDPIDGTSNYRIGNPFFNTQICLLQNQIPVLAVIRAPILKQVFSAKINRGAYLNDKKISVSKEGEVNKVMLSMGRGASKQDNIWFGKTLSKLIKYVRSCRIFGSCGLELAYLSAGMIDLHLDSGSQLYDFAPGVLLIREAGGVVVNLKGNLWSIHDRNILAGNKEIVLKTLQLLQTML